MIVMAGYAAVNKLYPPYINWPTANVKVVIKNQSKEEIVRMNEEYHP